jgi:single-stranded-DNA-specific exonuclease
MTHEAAFLKAVATFGPGNPVVLCHDDADGLSAGALLGRAFAGSSHGKARVRIVGRGESAWSDALREELAADKPGGLIVTDLGVQADVILPGVPTIIVDHHVPRSVPDQSVATLITGYGEEPTPTSSLLAHRCAQALVGEAAAELDWLAALGLLGDLGEQRAVRDFPEIMTSVKRTHTLKSLREVTSLVNAPRRTSRGDASPALRLLLAASGPGDVLSDARGDTAHLRAAQTEVKAALDAARKIAPIFAGPVALLVLDSPCQIHALIAQSWTHRLRRQVVIAMNAGFREGYVHFAARSASVPDLISFLCERAPPLGPDDQFAQGHRSATGGQVRVETWNRFAASLGFGPEAAVRVQ